MRPVEFLENVLFAVLDIAVAAQNVACLLVSKDGLELAKDKRSHCYYLLGVKEVFNRGKFSVHEAGSEDNAKIVFSHFALF